MISRSRIALAFLLATVLMALSGCGRGKSESSSGSSASPTGFSPIELEAQDAALAEIKSHWLQTGDGWVSAYNAGNQFAPNYQRQLHDITVIDIAPRPLDDSDKMNGVQWAGQVTFKKSTSREKGEAGFVMSDSGNNVNRTPDRWSPWVELTPELVQLQKVNGKWQIRQSTMLLAGTRPNSL